MARHCEINQSSWPFSTTVETNSTESITTVSALPWDPHRVLLPVYDCLRHLGEHKQHRASPDLYTHPAFPSGFYICAHAQSTNIRKSVTFPRTKTLAFFI